MKRAVIFINGDLAKTGAIKSELKKDDLVIAANGGSKLAEKLGITPDVVVGDLDSFTGEKKVKTVPYSKDKDFTDTELAIEYALSKGVKKIAIVGFLGRRLDHMTANLTGAVSLAAKGIKIVVIEGKQRLYWVTDKITVVGKPGDEVSLISLKGDSVVTATGLKWKVQRLTLKFGEGRGVSNVMLGKQAKIKLTKGILLVVHTWE